MRLERFLGLAHRNVVVFNAFNDALVALYTAAGKEHDAFCLGVTFSFLHGEFSRFAEMAQTNDDMTNILGNLCVGLETRCGQEASGDNMPRRSICDPLA